MNKLYKSTLLTALITVSALFSSANAYSQVFTVEGINYEVIDPINNHVAAVGGELIDNTENGYVFPSTVLGDNDVTYTLTAIGIDAFPESECSSVTIPATVTTLEEGCFFGSTFRAVYFEDGSELESIGDYAFCNCEELETIEFPDNLVSIGSLSFGFCQSLKSISLPESIVSLDYGTFFSCEQLEKAEINISGLIGEGCFFTCYKLSEVSLGNKVNSIGILAFGYTGITSLHIPASLTNIIPGALSLAPEMRTIEVAEDNPVYVSQDNMIFNKDFTTLIYGCPTITEFKFPATMTTFGVNCLWGNDYFETFNVPYGITRIEEGALGEWTALKSITFPETIEYLGNGCISENSLIESIEMPVSLKEIEFSPFSGCSALMSVTIPEENEYFTSYNGDIYTKDMTTLLFIASGKESVDVPEGVTSLYENAMLDCYNLNNVNLPQTLKNVGPYAFYECKVLETLTFPDAVEEIGTSACEYCYSLKSVDFGSGLKEIGPNAFCYLPIEEVTCRAPEPPLAYDNTFASSSESAILRVPEESINAYLSSEPWNSFQIEALPGASVKKIEGMKAAGFIVRNGDVIMTGDDTYAEIFDLRGNCIYRGKERVIRNLPAGIYIINGTKVKL